MRFHKHTVFSYSTLLTLSRIVFAPCIFAAVMCSKPMLAFALFITAAITDFFDGFLARNYGQATVLGACLDPLADKILVIVSFCALLNYMNIGFVPSYVVYFLLVRELVLLLGAFYVYVHVGSMLIIRPTLLGKLTTVLQMICISWGLLRIGTQQQVPWLYYSALDGMMICSTISLLQYMRSGYVQMVESKVVR